MSTGSVILQLVDEKPAAWIFQQIDFALPMWIESYSK